MSRPTPARLFAVALFVACSACDPAAFGAGTESGAGAFADPIGGDLFAESEPVPKSTANPAASACGEVPVTGRCKDDKTIERCLVVTGVGEPQVATSGCGKFESCTVDKGKAICMQHAGKCDPGANICKDAKTLRQCGKDGEWNEFSCDSGCKQTAAGAGCVPAGTVSYKVRVTYQFRGPNAALTDWAGQPSVTPVAGLLGLSLRKDGDGYTTVDAASTDAQGWLDIQIPSDKADAPLILLMAGKVGADGNSLDYVVARPDVGDGEQDVDLSAAAVDNAKLWSWTVDPGELDSGATVTVTEAQNSGVLRVFDYLRYIHGQANTILAGLTLPLVVWMRPNTAWNCGACFSDAPVSVLGFELWAQAWLPMTAQDTSYWADPVTGHEFGHWVMAGFSTSPREGGPHCLGVPTLPGQAWSEGFATAFSSLMRGDPRYYDKQDGSFFWLDIAKRKYPNKAWNLPKASLGLIQMHDENDVAAVVWALAGQPGIGKNNALFAVSSTRLQVDAAKRGYTRHTWGVTNCKKKDLVNTGDPAPFLADYLDALVCEGAPAASVDAVTVPNQQLPYPSNSPICD